MPFSVLIALLVVVIPYVVLTGVASLGSMAARGQTPPATPSAWPTVTVLIPLHTDSPEASLQALQACTYPWDHVEILLVDSKGVGETSPGADSEETTFHRISSLGEQSQESIRNPVKKNTASAQGDVILTLPAGGDPPSSWLQSMVRQCTPVTPVVVGPTVVKHEDLFLPRLQALQHLGRLALVGAASRFNLPIDPGTANQALHTEGLDFELNALPRQMGSSSSTSSLASASETYIPEPDAVVRISAVSSFSEYLRRQARWFRHSFRSPSWFVQGRAAGLWLVHTVLLACSAAAVALPAWRQPTLLALLGKMGANVILTVPAAKHYEQRGLLRSVVPSELMLVLTLPLAGIWALLGPRPTPEPHANT